MKGNDTQETMHRFLLFFKKRKQYILALSAIVVFITTYALILPALTLDEETAAEQGGIEVAAEQMESEAAEEAVAPDEAQAADDDQQKQDEQGGGQNRETQEADADQQNMDAPAFANALAFEGKGYTLSVEADESAALPEGTELTAEEITDKDKDYRAWYDEALKALQGTEGGEMISDLKFAKFYDISLTSDGEAIEPEASVDVTISYDKALPASDAEHLRIVHFGVDEEGALAPEVLDTGDVEPTIEEEQLTEATFAAESFSVYAVVYTVDFHWEVDGKKYEFSIPGGGFVSFSQMVEALGIAGRTAADGESDEKDGAPLALGDIEVSGETRTFVENVESVTFSTPELLSVSKAEEDTTVGAIKDSLGLECEYSADLTEEQIAEIDAAEVEGGDWALISLQPFTSKESLTITMKNGDRIVVDVTDYQDVTDDVFFDSAARFVIWAESGGRTYALKTDGSTAEINRNQIDALGPEFQWTIARGYRTWGENFDRYYIRPADDSSRSIRLSGYNVVQGGNLIQSITLGQGGIRIYHPNNQGTWRLEGSEWNSLNLNNQTRTFEGRSSSNNTPISPIHLSRQVSNPEVHPSSQYIALSPMNESGVLLGDPVSGNVSSTQYKNFEIDGHTISGMEDLQYARIYIPVTYNDDGTATITLPSNEQLTSGFRVSDAEAEGTSHTIKQDPNKLTYVLKGWVNIADEDNNGQFDYYSVTEGPVQVTVSRDKLDVFYADWEPANYNYTIRNPIETADTSGFIKIGVWDYNEMYNLNTSTAYKVDRDQRLRQARDRLEQEEWYINPTTAGSGTFVQFVDNTDQWNCWQYGTLGNTQDRGDRPDMHYTNDWSNYSGSTPRFGIVGAWGQPTSTPVLESLFDKSNEQGSGVNYLGQGNFLFSYDPDTKEYSYDSAANGAVYNKQEQRFYVADRPKTHDTYMWDVYGGHTEERTGFLPFNDYYADLDYRNGTTNYWFGMNTEVDFWLPDVPGTSNANKVGSNNDDMVFTFRGDDDVWVFIDGKLALDIGGIHEALNGSINFTTGVIRVDTEQGGRTWNLSDMGIGAGGHKLEFYYVERGGNASNCEIKFNLMPRWVQDPVAVNRAEVTKTWSDDTPDELKEALEFSLTSGSSVLDTVGYEDGTDDGETWTYVWDYLDPAADYAVTETENAAFDTSTSNTVNEDRQSYWAPTAYDDTIAYGVSEVLLGNGRDSGGKLLKSNGTSASSADAVISHDVVHSESVTDNTVKWTVSEYSQTDKHFYLRDSSGKYLSIRNGNISLVTAKSQASWFYMGPTGDLNDAYSNNRVVVDGQGNIGVGTKKGSDDAGIESADRVHIYAYQQIPTKTFDYQVENTYLHTRIQFKKVSVDDVNLNSPGLQGAVFALYNTAPKPDGTFEGAPLTTLTSGTGGYLVANAASAVSTAGSKILDVTPGTYYLKETKAPDGYDSMVDVIRFTVNEDGTFSFVQPEILLDPKYKTTASESIGGETVQVPTGLIPNTAGVELPQAGGPGTRWIYLLGSVLLLGAGILIAARRRMSASGPNI